MADFVGAEVGELEVEVLVQDAVLGLDVTVEDASLVQVHCGQQRLSEVVTRQRLRERHGPGGSE